MRLMTRHRGTVSYHTQLAHILRMYIQGASPAPLDGRRSQTRVMPIYYVEEDGGQTHCQVVESVRPALHSEKCAMN